MGSGMSGGERLWGKRDVQAGSPCQPAQKTECEMTSSPVPSISLSEVELRNLAEATSSPTGKGGERSAQVQKH